MADTVSLREYVDARFDALEKQTALALVAVKEQTALALTNAKEAVTKAEMAADKRFEGVNKFREALDDNARLLMPRLEIEQTIKGINKEIGELANRVNAGDNVKKGGLDFRGNLIAVLGALTAIGAIVIAVLK